MKESDVTGLTNDYDVHILALSDGDEELTREVKKLLAAIYDLGWLAGRDAAADVAESVEDEYGAESYSDKWVSENRLETPAPSVAIRALQPPSA